MGVYRKEKDKSKYIPQEIWVYIERRRIDLSTYLRKFIHLILKLDGRQYGVGRQGFRNSGI